MNLLNTLIYFLKKNPIKIISFLIFGFLFHLSYKINPVNIKIIEPIYTFTISNNAHYYTYIENDNIYTILSQKIPDKNNKIILKEDNNDRHFFMFLTSIILFIILMSSFSKNKDINWEIVDIIAKYKLYKVECEIVNDDYVYIYNRKLLAKSKYKISEYSIEDLIKSLLENPNLFPDYETKKQRRKRLLSNI